MYVYIYVYIYIQIQSQLFIAAKNTKEKIAHFSKLLYSNQNKIKEYTLHLSVYYDVSRSLG